MQTTRHGATATSPPGRPAAVPRPRGDRLRPSRLSRLYWHLTCLRRAMSDVVDSHVADRGFARLVDFGCGNVPYRPLFARHVGEYVGADLPGNPEANVEVAAGRLPIDGSTVDVVLSSQVLEHADDPTAYLAECRRILSPRGILILSTHGVWRYHPDPVDYWRWTSSGLQKTIESAGFNVIDFRGVMAPSSYALQLLQDAVGRSLPRGLRGLWYGGMQVLIEVADRISAEETRRRDACVYVVVARRNQGGPSAKPTDSPAEARVEFPREIRP